MATREDIVIDKDTLLCSICLEPFARPRTLPCLHSFCQLCLEEYIKVSAKTETVKGFDCPVCRAFTHTPEESLHEHEWAGSFPHNFTLTSILDSSKTGHAAMDRVKQLCDPCRREAIEVIATSHCVDCQENMCTDCQRHHRKSKATSEHTLQNIDSTASEGKINSMDFIMQSLIQCAKHPLQKIQYICEDHNELCCSDCSTFIHKQCEHVVSIDEKAELCTSESTLMADMMNELESHAELLLDGERKQMTALDEAMDKTKEGLSEVKQKMLETFEELFNSTLGKMQSEHKDISAKTLDNITDIQTLKTKVKHFKERFDTVNTHGDKSHVYLYVMQLKKEMNRLSADMRSLQKLLECNIISVDVKKDLSEMLNWVSIRRQPSESQIPLLPSFRPGRERVAILKRHISLPFLNTRSCVWQTEHRIFVCDYQACQIATFNATDPTCLKAFRSPSPIGSMVKLNTSQIAVSCPDNSTVLIMDMNQEPPSGVTEIKTHSPPWGLAYNSIDKHLLVQSRHDGTVSFVGLNGIPMGTLPLTDTAKTAVQNTYFIAFDSKIKVCYLSCFSLNKVMAIDLQGRILFEYSHETLQAPLGIALGPDDDIYVCSPHGNCIHQLSKSGHLLRERFTEDDGVTNPWTIGFDDRRNQCVVACSGSTPIRVFDFV